MPLIEDRSRPSSMAVASRCTTAPIGAVPAIGGTGVRARGAARQGAGPQHATQVELGTPGQPAAATAARRGPPPPIARHGPAPRREAPARPHHGRGSRPPARTGGHRHHFPRFAAPATDSARVPSPFRAVLNQPTTPAKSPRPATPAGRQANPVRKHAKPAGMPLRRGQAQAEPTMAIARPGLDKGSFHYTEIPHA